jgi:hypothetical protein
MCCQASSAPIAKPIEWLSAEALQAIAGAALARIKTHGFASMF